MIVRIVKMTFRHHEADEFGVFSQSIRATILAFEGCEHLRIYRDINDPCVFFSYSKWRSAEDLDAYRASDFFRTTWAKTKTGFSQKAEAWSVSEL